MSQVPPLLDEIEEKWPAANVAAQVFGPHDLLGHLVQSVLSGDPNFLPSLQLFVVAEDGEPVVAYSSCIRWNGAPAPSSFDDLMRTVFETPGTIGYYCARVCGETGAYFNAIASALGFVFPLLRGEWRDGGWHGGWVERDSIVAASNPDQTVPNHKPVLDWVECESRFVEEMCSALTQRTFTG